MNPEQLLASTVSLARNINDGDDGSALAVPIVVHHSANLICQSPGLIETALAPTRPWEAIARIRHDGDEARLLAAEGGIGCAHAAGRMRHHSIGAGQCPEPRPAAFREAVLRTQGNDPSFHKVRSTLASSGWRGSMRLRRSMKRATWAERSSGGRPCPMASRTATAMAVASSSTK